MSFPQIESPAYFIEYTFDFRLVSCLIILKPAKYITFRYESHTPHHTTISMHFTLPGQGIDTKYIKWGKTKLKSLFKKSISSFEKNKRR